MIAREAIIKKSSTLALSFLLIAPSVSPLAIAEELVITGNGAGSDNTVEVSSRQDVHVDQSNNADVNNDINVDANTGGNDANDNTGGDVGITTGDISTATSVSNSLNSSTVNHDGCCPTGGITAVISGNGAHSDNRIDLDFRSDTRVNIDQRADVRNDVDVDANTGRNDANDNTGGDVSIRTGDILSLADLENGPINVASAQISVPANGVGEGLFAKVDGNGSFSLNEIDAFIRNTVRTFVDNVADVVNDLTADLNTGDNDANDNTGGDVAVATGDIVNTIKVKNIANKSDVTIDLCCEKEEKKEEEEEKAPEAEVAAPAAEAAAPSPTAAQAAQAEVTPQVMGAAAENILPETGSNFFFLALIANVVMMFLGAYLRLRSGRSPTGGYAF